MTEQEEEFVQAQNWIFVDEDYALTEAINMVFRKDWIREFEENIFEVPGNQLTNIGKTVMKRLVFARDILGIELNYDTFLQVFQKVKSENWEESQSTKALRDFKLKEALAKEDYETAHQLMNEN